MSHPTPEVAEAQSVRDLSALVGMARSLGVHRLLYATINWEKLFNSGSPPGAANPDVARMTYTRLARREQRARQMAKRSGGVRGLLDAIRLQGVSSR